MVKSIAMDILSTKDIFKKRKSMVFYCALLYSSKRQVSSEAYSNIILPTLPPNTIAMGLQIVLSQCELESI